MCGFNQAHAWILGLGFKKLVHLNTFDTFTNTVHMMDSNKLSIFYQLPNSLHFATDEKGHFSICYCMKMVFSI